jgi:hypothetical protein
MEITLNPAKGSLDKALIDPSVFLDSRKIEFWFYQPDPSTEGLGC